MTETAKTHSELCVIAERIKAAMASCVESFCMEVADSIENEIGRGLTEQERQQISETASGLLVAQDQLEAERQRADKAESYARERDSENESIALTVGRLRLDLAKLRGKLDTPIVIPPRKTAKDYVDDEFSNADLAAIYNAARLELKARIKSAGFTAKDGE
ncbi:hypothetical protein V2154_16810 [Ewingella sp. CoE-038-23]|uniref:hypothetical protein n=1 Tax=Ewingella docleensis TaxID=3118588 RepID=UPI0033659633